MNYDKKKGRDPAAPPRIAIPDGKGGHTLEEVEMFERRKPRGAPGVLPRVEGTRRGIFTRPGSEPLTQPSPGEKSEIAMVIDDIDLPSVGFIRAKPIADGDRYVLTVFPPGAGALAGADPGTMVEWEVSNAEVRRIESVAPHLIATRCHNAKPAIRRRTGASAAKRPLEGSGGPYFARRPPLNR